MNTLWEFNVGKANQLVEAAGWAVPHNLVASLSAWDSVFYNLKDWYRKA